MTLKKPYPQGCDKLVLSRSRSSDTALPATLTRRGFPRPFGGRYFCQPICIRLSQPRKGNDHDHRHRSSCCCPGARCAPGRLDPPLHLSCAAGRARSTFADAFSPRAGPTRNRSRISRRVCRSRRSRNSRAIGRRNTTGARSRRKLNALPQFLTEIDGLDIHFAHVRSKHENALPIIVTHGWPGSLIEQLKIIDPLVNPTAHGGKASDAFHVVIPNMPGYGFSGKPTTTGWDCPRIARAWVVLMNRLGYKRYVAQGGDWGGVVVDEMGVQAPPELIGIHTNLPRAVPPDISRAMQGSGPAPAGLSDEEREQFERLQFVYAKGIAYAL